MEALATERIREQRAAAERWKRLAPYVDVARQSFAQKQEAWLEQQRKAREQRQVLEAERRRREQERQQQADRAARRQKLRTLTVALQTDREGKLDPAQSYQAAGYVRTERDGKCVWTYPPGDLREERQAVYAAWKEWDTRRRERLAYERAEEERARKAIHG